MYTCSICVYLIVRKGDKQQQLTLALTETIQPSISLYLIPYKGYMVTVKQYRISMKYKLALWSDPALSLE